jgi:hypothetical protein
MGYRSQKRAYIVNDLHYIFTQVSANLPTPKPRYNKAKKPKSDSSNNPNDDRSTAQLFGAYFRASHSRS